MRHWLMSLALSCAVAAEPASAEWRRAESANFVVLSEESESRIRERVELLEDFDRLLRVVTSVNEPPAPIRLHVYVVGRHSDLELLRPATTESMIGFYTATPDGIAAFVDSSARSDQDELLLHEYAHHFMRQYRPNAYPAWFTEGFAEYFATVRFRRRHIDIGDFSRGRIYSLESGWLPMERVLGGDSSGLDAEAGAAFYAQSWLLVHYFYSTPERQRALSRYLVLARIDPEAALPRATGMDVEQLTRELRAYFRQGSVRMRRMERASIEAPVPIAVTTMPRAADDLMLFEAALRIGILEDDREQYLQRIRTAAARHPGDPFASRVLAHAELLHGDPEAADRLLGPLLAARPNDAGLIYLNGMRHLVAAREDEPPEGAAAAAADWLGRAADADPAHFQALYRLAEARRRSLADDGDVAESPMLRAYRLAPQVTEIVMNAAVALMEAGDHAEAARLLGPLAVDPHDSGLAQAARELLGQARAMRLRESVTRLHAGVDETETEQPELE